jgi:hypothetical protein
MKFGGLGEAAVVNVQLDRLLQKRPTLVSKETYTSVKRDLH